MTHIPHAPAISIIVPAYNAERSLARTLQSVRDQTLAEWECIVINDGSTDRTLDLAREGAALDHRITVLHQENAGVCAARNAGIARARAPWILFLDSDDTIAATHLALLLQAGQRHDGADLIYCDWRHAGIDGKPGDRHRVEVSLDPFTAFARNCAFPIHAALTRTRALRSLGGFDTALRMCEDWDLWQRLARSGHVFRKCPGALAEYQLVPGSASANHFGFLEGADIVMRRGHGADPRLDPHGLAPPLPDDDLQHVLTAMTFWIAGRTIGARQDAAPLLDRGDATIDLRFDPLTAASTLMDGIMAGAGLPRPDWQSLWPGLRPLVQAFLQKAEPRIALPDFTRLALHEAERRMLKTVTSRDADIGSFALRHFVPARDPADLRLAPGIDRLVGYCGTPSAMLGHFEIAVDGHVPAARLRELIREFPVPETPAAEMPAPTVQSGAIPGTAPYLAQKYRQTLAAIPGRAGRALLLGSGDGHLAALLSGQVDRLLVADRSFEAMDPARARCADLGNVVFGALDPSGDPMPAGMELVLCIDDFGHIDTIDDLARTADRIAGCLAPGGHLVMAQDMVLGDMGAIRGFRSGARWGAASITEVFARCKGLEQIEVRSTDLYRIAALRRRDPAVPLAAVRQVRLPEVADLPDDLARSFDWAGSAPARFRQDPPGIPALMYHRICDDPAPALGRYATTPSAFAAQMEWLRQNGFRAITTEEFARAIWEGQALPPRPVMVTFDDGYRDNLHHGVPVLRRLGMTATIFIPTDHVGTTADWDVLFGTPAPLMDWSELAQARKAGLSLASHNTRHRPMTGQDFSELRDGARRSRQELKSRLGIETTTLAYPYGIHDQAIERALLDEGYRVAFTTLSRRYRKGDRIMAVPRIEVRGDMGIEDFAAAINAG